MNGKSLKFYGKVLCNLKMNEYLINKECVIQKFSGKGGWFYVAIPEILPNNKIPFGWIIINGFIDDYELTKVKLMSMGKGILFLAVNVKIRKAIKKQKGDTVHIKLSIDKTPLIIPKEIVLCFENEPQKAYKNFINLSEGQQKVFLDWIYTAKTEEKKAERILTMIDKVLRNKSFYDKLKG